MKRLTDYGTFYDDEDIKPSKREEPVFGAKQSRTKNGPPEERMPRVVMPRGEAPPTQQLAPRRRQLADKAAEAAQDMIDLQETLELTEAERNDLKIQVGVFEREIIKLRAELQTALDDARTHRDIVASIETRFETIAELLLPVIERRPRRPPPPPEPERPRGTFEEEMAKLVATDHEAPRRD